MIRFLLLLIVGFAVGGLLAFLMLRDPGYVLVAYDGATMETSLWFAIACFAALIALAYLVGFLIRRAARSGFALSGWFLRRRVAQARNRSLEGIVLFAEGRWHEAKQALLDSADRVDTPVANLFGAAAAANELARYEERDDILDRARKSTPQAEFAVELRRAELQRAAGQWTRSIATLNRLRQRAPRHPVILKGLFDAHEALGDSEAVAELAPSLPKEVAPDMVEVQAATWQARFAKLKTSAESAEHARRAWQSVPKRLRSNEGLVLDYVDALGDDAPRKAEAVLRRALQKDWREAWVRRYAGVGADRAKQLATAKQWLKKHPRDPVLLLTLGRLSAAAGDVLEAKSYLEASLRLRQDVDTLTELGLLCSEDGKPEAANDYLGRALALNS